MTTPMDLDDRIRDAVRTLAVTHEPQRTGGEVAGWLQTLPPPGPARRTRLLVAAATAAVIVLAVGLVIQRDPSAKTPVAVDTVDDDPTPSAQAPASSTVPLAGRGDHVTVWTGNEVVIWGGDVEAENMGVRLGGDVVYADGAAYRPSTGEWRSLPPSPLPGSEELASAVWTGSEVLILQAGEAAAWNPTTGSWRQVATPPGDGSFGLVAADGVVFDASAPAMWLPTDDRWETLSDLPAPLTQASSAWTGDALVVAGTQLGRGGVAGGFEGWAYIPPAGRWQPLPALDLSAQATDLAVVDGAVVVVNHERHAARLDRGRSSWTVLDDLPVEPGKCFPTLRTVGVRVAVVMCGQVGVLVGDHWVIAPDRVSALTGAVTTETEIWLVEFDAGDDSRPPTNSLRSLGL